MVLERQVMRDPEQPAAQAVAAPAFPKMLKKREEHLLNHLLGIGNLETAAEQEAQQAGSELVKKSDDLFLEALLMDAEPGSGG